MKFSLFVIFILVLNFTSAISICIDTDPPTWNASFDFAVTGGNVLLDWEPATDIPSCSGIEHYEIYRSSDSVNFVYVASTSETEYLDEGLPDGSYQYLIHAFDLAGHNEGQGLLNQGSVQVGGTSSSSSSSGGGGGGGSSGGGGGSLYDDSLYTCKDWSICENGIQYRTCNNGAGITKNETRECSPDFSSLSSENYFSEETEQTSTNFMTGAIIGVRDFAKTPQGKGALIIAGAIVVAGITITIVKRGKDNTTFSEQ